MNKEEIEKIPTITLLNMIREATKNKMEWEKYRLVLVGEWERRKNLERKNKGR